MKKLRSLASYPNEDEYCLGDKPRQASPPACI